MFFIKNPNISYKFLQAFLTKNEAEVIPTNRGFPGIGYFGFVFNMGFSNLLKARTLGSIKQFRHKLLDEPYSIEHQ